MKSPDPRKKKKKRTSKKTHKEYPPETEAAWYVVKEFISPLLCSYKYFGAMPFNTNEVLNHHFSGTGVFQPYRYGKGKYHLHLFQAQDHYFRSSYNSKHFTGYHRSDSIAQNSVINEILSVTTKREEYDGYYVILCKIDIDGHNGEKDCEQVAIWLNNTYFKQSYWEPSTSFTGRHGYTKIAIPIGTPLEEVHRIFNQLFELLDIKRQITGYKAPVDMPCGLPSIVTWDDTIETPKNLPKIFWEDYKCFRSLRNRIKELKKTKHTDELERLNLQISDKFHYKDILKIVETPVPASIKSSQCGKLPRFNRTHKNRPSLDDIKSFYKLEYYNFSFFVNLLDTLENDPEVLAYTPAIPSPSSPAPISDTDDDAILNTPFPHKYDSCPPVDRTISAISPHSSPSSCPGLGTTELGLPFGHSISSPLQGKNVVSLSQTTENENSNYTPGLTSRNYCLVKLGSKQNKEDVRSKKDGQNEKNEYIYREYTNDANRRTGIYITSFLRDYYRANYRVPTTAEIEDEVCAGYRSEYGTGGEDKYDRKRIIGLLDKCISSFRPELAGGRPKYERFKFIPYIKNTFCKAEYADILKDTGARKYRPNNIILDLFGGYLLTHLSRNKSLTLSTYDGFHTFLKNYKIETSDNMCLACRLLYEHYEWLEKLNGDYEMPTFDHVDGKVVKCKGRSMAYTLTPKFPFYSEFEKAIGPKDIDKARKRGMASMEDLDSMGQTA